MSPGISRIVLINIADNFQHDRDPVQWNIVECSGSMFFVFSHASLFLKINVNKMEVQFYSNMTEAIGLKRFHFNNIRIRHTINSTVK